MREHKIELFIDSIDFEQTFGRQPTDDTEFEWFCFYCQKGLMNGHINWDIVFQCAKEEMATNYKEQRG